MDLYVPRREEHSPDDDALRETPQDQERLGP
jgi:hypothetical protein